MDSYALILIFVSLLIHIFCYLIISKKEKNFLNVFLPILAGILQINFFLEPLYIIKFGLFGSFYSYIYIYIYYAVTIVLTTIGYIYTPDNKIIKLPFSKPSRPSLISAYFILFVGFLVYLPVLLEFKEYIFNPREIYIRTRSGYGINYFISSLLTFIAFITFLFSKKLNRIRSIIFISLCTLFIYLHGSKGQVVILIFILAIYFAYIKVLKFNIFKIAVWGGLGLMAIIGLFVLTTNFEYDNTLDLMVGYSDYNRNAMLVIDTPPQDYPYYGKLSFETNYYSRLPRILFPDKPKEYGSFRLAKKYFPQWFYEESGSPAFGIGVDYADYGDYAIIFAGIFAFITGVLLKLFVNRLKLYKSIGDFVVVLFFTGVSLIPIGAGYLLPEHLILALLLNMILSVRFKVG